MNEFVSVTLMRMAHWNFTMAKSTIFKMSEKQMADGRRQTADARRQAPASARQPPAFDDNFTLIKRSNELHDAQFLQRIK